MIRLAAALALCASPALAQGVAERLNDYPTEARADYVFACMASNGQSREVLRRCSCSICWSSAARSSPSTWMS